MKKEKSMLGFFYTVTTMENFEKDIKNYQELVVRDGFGGLKVDVYLPSFKLFKNVLTYTRELNYMANVVFQISRFTIIMTVI